MSWRIPSMAALTAFEAAARHMSFTKAAAELHLTQSAVSRQIRALEDSLGVPLFERVRQRLVLTDAGRGYSEEVRLALARMQEATLNLLSHQGYAGLLRFATQPAFGMKWLIPRLGAFNAAHPEILVNLVTRSSTPLDFEVEPLDAAIHFGEADWKGVAMERLGDDGERVVCAPGYARRKLRRPGELAGYVLLQNTRRPDAWQRWLAAAGARGVNAWAGPRYEHYYMIGQAAVAGLGVALLPTLLVADDLAARRLIEPFKVAYESGEAYYLAYPESKREDRRLAVFRSWLVGEVGRSLTPA
jgi:LysR family glycine cleavage system transcriptional activator